MSIRHLLQNHRVLLLSLALNVLLIVVCTFTLQKAQFYYKEYRIFRPLAQGVSEATTFEIPTDRPEKVLVMYGDSRISEWKPLPKLNDTLIVNAGVAGDTVLEMHRRLDQDVLRLQPDVVILQTGMNDLTMAVTRGVNNPEQVIAQMRSQIQTTIDTLIDNDIQVIITPVLPAAPADIGRRLFWRNDLDALVVETNRYLKALAGQYSLQWIDLHGPLHDDQGKLRTDWYVDPLHLYQARYKSLNQTIEAALNKQ